MQYHSIEIRIRNFVEFYMCDKLMQERILLEYENNAGLDQLSALGTNLIIIPTETC